MTAQRLSIVIPGLKLGHSLQEVQHAKLPTSTSILYRLSLLQLEILNLQVRNYILEEVQLPWSEQIIMKDIEVLTDKEAHSQLCYLDQAGEPFLSNGTDEKILDSVRQHVEQIQQVSFARTEVYEMLVHLEAQYIRRCHRESQIKEQNDLSYQE